MEDRQQRNMQCHSRIFRRADNYTDAGAAAEAAKFWRGIRGFL